MSYFLIKPVFRRSQIFQIWILEKKWKIEWKSFSIFFQPKNFSSLFKFRDENLKEMLSFTLEKYLLNKIYI